MEVREQNVYCEIMKRWSPEELLQFFEFNGLDMKKLKPILDNRIDGKTFLELKESNKLFIILPDLDFTLKMQINNTTKSYKPCLSSHTETEGLPDSAGMESELLFKVITKDEDGAIRPPIGQKIEIHLPEEDFRIENFDNRNGEIDISICPLKVGPFKIEIFLDKHPIKGSPFSLVVVPPSVPIHNIQRSDLEDLEEKYKGNFGRVYKGCCLGATVAVKEMLEFKKEYTEKKMFEFLDEVNILQRLHHPNIITFLGVCIEGDNVKKWYIVLEWAEKASLQKVLKQEKDLSWEVKFKFMTDIGRGMRWLHSRANPIIHFDLKPANILVMEDYTCKIADFGLALVSEMKESCANRGTMLYMPPETLRRKWYYKVGRDREAASLSGIPPEQLPKVDVYSFGLTMWEIIFQEEVFVEFDTLEEFCSAVCDRGCRPSTEKIHPILADIIIKCWDADNVLRPNFRELNPQLETARLIFFLEYRSEVGFWQANFHSNTRVVLKDFVQALWRNTVKNRINNFPGNTFVFQSELEKLLVNPNSTTKEITLKSFCRFIEWFGPINQKVYFDDFCEIMIANWFFPDIADGYQAVATMEQKRSDDKCTVLYYIPGSFLVRLTERTKEIAVERKSFPFTITFVDQNCVKHSRIGRTQSGYSLKTKEKLSVEMPTLRGLIDHLCKNFSDTFSSPLPKTNSIPPIY